MNHYQVTLRDALNNYGKRSGASDDYCKGVLVGLASGLIARGMTWDKAMSEIRENWPKDVRDLTEQNCPESWLEVIRLRREQ